MSFLTEFKQFAIRGNVIDLAVAVIIGTAFGKIVSSLVNDILMPLLGFLLGGVNIAKESFKPLGLGVPILRWGLFLQTIIDFTVISFSIFLVIKLIHLQQKRTEDAPLPLSREEVLLTEIRDLLKREK